MNYSSFQARWLSGRRGASALVAAVSLAGGLALAAPSSSAYAGGCASATLVAVRGSGETASDYSGYGHTLWDVWQKFHAQVANSSSHEVDYPAVPVGYGGLFGYLPNYNQSIATGKQNLNNYINSFMASSCATQTYLVLAGYSQGAQVVGDVYQSLPTAARARVAGIALIGDPRFNGSQDAVNVGDYDPTENGVYSDVGGKRVIPAAQSDSVRSYCMQGDPVCNFGFTNINFCRTHASACPHVHYFDWYDQRKTYTAEAADFLASRTPAGGGGGGAAPASKLDLVFAIDTTGSMSPYIASTVASANSIVDTLSAKGVDFRIGVVDYKDSDSCSNYDAVTDLGFSMDKGSIESALSSLQSKVYGGCDLPEDVLSGVDRAISFPWRNGVKKVVIQMGDAPGKDPEPHSGLTTASVAAHALAVDPAIVDPILVGSDNEAHQFDQALADATGGQTFDASANPADVGPTILNAILSIISASYVYSPYYPTSTTASLPAGQNALVIFGINNSDGSPLSDDTATSLSASCGAVLTIDSRVDRFGCFRYGGASSHKLAGYVSTAGLSRGTHVLHVVVSGQGVNLTHDIPISIS